MKRSPVPLLITVVVLLFFYLPLLFLIINSFNDSRFGGPWRGFTLRWYERLLEDREIWRATRNTLIVALVSTSISVVLGTLSAWVLHRWNSRLQRAHFILIYAPLVVPDVLMGISLLLFFVNLKVSLGLATITIAHTAFCVSYVTFVILGRLQDFDDRMIEAARDLGASWVTVFRRIVLPLLMPGILAGSLLAFTLSIDDFVITFFVSGPGSTTLPVLVFSMMKHGAPTVVNALSTVLMLLTLISVIAGQLLLQRNRATLNINQFADNKQ